MSDRRTEAEEAWKKAADAWKNFPFGNLFRKDSTPTKDKK